jgi:hypothetical protein
MEERIISIGCDFITSRQGLTGAGGDHSAQHFTRHSPKPVSSIGKR